MGKAWDRHLFALRDMAARKGLPTPTIFTDEVGKLHDYILPMHPLTASLFTDVPEAVQHCPEHIHSVHPCSGWWRVWSSKPRMLRYWLRNHGALRWFAASAIATGPLVRTKRIEEAPAPHPSYSSSGVRIHTYCSNSLGLLWLLAVPLPQDMGARLSVMSYKLGTSQLAEHIQQVRSTI